MFNRWWIGKTIQHVGGDKSSKNNERSASVDGVVMTLNSESMKLDNNIPYESGQVLIPFWLFEKSSGYDERVGKHV